MSTDDDRRRIIINSIIASPMLTTDERSRLRPLSEKSAPLTWAERRFVRRLLMRVLKGV